jgi:Tol biopolymer transport system component
MKLQTLENARLPSPEQEIDALIEEARRRQRRRRGTIAAILLLVAAVLVVLGGSGKSPRPRSRNKNAAASAHKTRFTPTPPADAIVFDKAANDSLDAQIEIVYVPAGGGAVVSLTTARTDGMVAAEPRWSLDGSRIAFIMSPRGHLTRYAGDGDIYVMNANGTGIRRLTDGLDASSPAWSPGGSRIAFIKGQGQALAVMRADGSDQHVIARARSYYAGPAWSPDGQAIAYQSDLGRNMDDTAIFTIRADGTDERQLTPRAASAGSPAWSPNGSRIAYSSSNEQLWVMNSDGTNAHQITTCRLPCVENFDPAWSPTGRELVFVRQENGGAARRLYILNLSTHALRPVTPKSRWADSPDWRR